MKKPERYLYAAALAFVVAAAGYISSCCYQLMLIHGDSMLPAYHSLQLVVLERRPESYERGDVVLCSCPALDADIVKRIAAVSGDRICVEDDCMYINGAASASLPEYGRRADYLREQSFVVPEGMYILLGDNADHSIDSRFKDVGLAAESELLGRVVNGRR